MEKLTIFWFRNDNHSVDVYFSLFGFSTVYYHKRKVLLCDCQRHTTVV